VPVANAFNFGDMMNPGRWFGGKNRDRYNDYDDFGPYGPGPFGPYGGGPYGGPYGGGPWGGPYGGAPGYGYPGAYGAAPYAAPPAAPARPAAPAQSSGSKGEIDALKRRIEELESQTRRQPAQGAPSSDWPSAPAFRPMNQY